MLTLETFDDAARFRDVAFSFLLEDEALNCVLIGALGTMRASSARRYLAVLRDDGDVVGALWWTPPSPFGVTRLPEAALPLVLDALAGFPTPIAGIVGPSETADALAAAWIERTGVPVRARMRLRFFLAEAITAPPPVPGGMRVATEADTALLAEWNLAFAVDCGLVQEAPDPRRAAEEAIAEGSRWLWEVDGTAMAMASAIGRTPNGIRINWVYTPVAGRRRGYAGNLVAALSQKHLEEGLRFCFLATDLANPTSNRLYQSLGYRAAGDASHWTLEDRSRAG